VSVVSIQGLALRFGERTLFEGLDLELERGELLAVLGPNGTGKTSLVRILLGLLQPTAGEVRIDGFPPRERCHRIGYVPQQRIFDRDLVLRGRDLVRLGLDGHRWGFGRLDGEGHERIERVLTQVGATGYADAPIGRLSGGERARVLIAQLMLQPADVLLLDEPTNDLDIPTLEILEESLLDYRGALVLVTHDRYMLDRVSTVILGLDGLGHAERFADFSQWEAWQKSRLSASKDAASKTTEPQLKSSAPANTPKRKLSYKEARELETIEERIAGAEKQLQAKHDSLLDPAVMSDAKRLAALSLELEADQKAIDDLYARWAQLEAKLQ